jgi:hypothetical protein
MGWIKAHRTAFLVGAVLLLLGLASGLFLGRALERDEVVPPRVETRTRTEAQPTTVVRTVTTETAKEERPLPENWSLCTNAAAGYSIGYPAGWYTTHPEPEQACQLFDPEPFPIPGGTDFPPPALSVAQTPGSVAEYLQVATDPAFWRTVTREDTTVAGHPAVRIETEFVASEGESEPGTRSYGYVLDRDGTIVTVFATGLPGDAGYSRYKAVADKAVTTLRFF